MSEEAVTKATISFLKQLNWDVLDYDFPGSGTGRNFHIGSLEDYKNRRRVIPDIIAYKEGTILWFENKNKETLSDYKKIFSLSQERESLLAQITQAYWDKTIDNLLFAISFSGNSTYLPQAIEYKVNCILQMLSPLPQSEMTVLFDSQGVFEVQA